MTTDPDAPSPEDPEDVAPDEDRKLDEDAAWRLIIENYGPEPDVEPAPHVPPTPLVEPPEAVERRPVLEPRWRDPLNTEATWDDEGHFVPPELPPAPPVETRRKLAWAGLFGFPLLMLVAVVLGWEPSSLLMKVLVCWFVGGFGFLVATMPRTRGGDGPDNGAVV